MKRGCKAEKLAEVVKILEQEKQLPPKYQDYALLGNYNGCRECHISPDWLLIYKIEKDRLVLSLMHTGTYSDLF